MCDITICALCKQQLRAARLLPCLDSFCLACLENLVGDQAPGDELSCPTCEAVLKISGEGLSTLPANSFVDSLLRIRRCREEERDLECSICSGKEGKSKTATSYCIECCQNMCEQCSSYHLKFTSTKGHKIISREEEGASVWLEEVNWCDMHENYRQELYCKECRCSVCVKCYIENHNSHFSSDISVIAVEFREQMQQNVDEMEQLALDSRSEEQDLCEARDNVLAQVGEAEAVVLEKRNELIACIERDTNELMNDLQYLRNYVSSEFDASHSKIAKRSEEVEKLKRFSKAVISEGSPSVVVSMTNILKQRASEIRTQYQKSHAGKRRPVVDVTFQHLGLSRLSQVKSKRKINLIGRISATIMPPHCMQQTQPNCFSSATKPKYPEPPVFPFASAQAESEYLCSGTRQIFVPGIRQSERFGRCERNVPPTPQISDVIAQRRLPTESENYSSSSDEEIIQDSDEGAQTGTVDAATEQESSAKIDEDDNSFSASATVFFSHEAKLRRFYNGSWRLRAVGKLEVIRLQQQNTAYLLMKNKPTRKTYLMQQVTQDLSLEPVPDSSGRELIWIDDEGFEDGHYNMFSVKFKTKSVADSFRMAFVCVRQLITLGLAAETGRLTNVLPGTVRVRRRRLAVKPKQLQHCPHHDHQP